MNSKYIRLDRQALKQQEEAEKRNQQIYADEIYARELAQQFSQELSRENDPSQSGQAFGSEVVHLEEDSTDDHENEIPLAHFLATMRSSSPKSPASPAPLSGTSRKQSRAPPKSTPKRNKKIPVRKTIRKARALAASPPSPDIPARTASSLSPTPAPGPSSDPAPPVMAIRAPANPGQTASASGPPSRRRVLPACIPSRAPVNSAGHPALPGIPSMMTMARAIVRPSEPEEERAPRASRATASNIANRANQNLPTVHMNILHRFLGESFAANARVVNMSPALPREYMSDAERRPPTSARASNPAPVSRRPSENACSRPGPASKPDVLSQEAQTRIANAVADPPKTCSICLENWSTGKVSAAGVAPRCGHCFHDACLANWVSGQKRKFQKPLCPICRAGL